MGLEARNNGRTLEVRVQGHEASNRGLEEPPPDLCRSKATPEVVIPVRNRDPCLRARLRASLHSPLLRHDRRTAAKSPKGRPWKSRRLAVTAAHCCSANSRTKNCRRRARRTETLDSATPSPPPWRIPCSRAAPHRHRATAAACMAPAEGQQLCARACATARSRRSQGASTAASATCARRWECKRPLGRRGDECAIAPA